MQHDARGHDKHNLKLCSRTVLLLPVHSKVCAARTTSKDSLPNEGLFFMVSPRIRDQGVRVNPALVKRKTKYFKLMLCFDSSERVGAKDHVTGLHRCTGSPYAHRGILDTLKHAVQIDSLQIVQGFRDALQFDLDIATAISVAVRLRPGGHELHNMTPGRKFVREVTQEGT